MVCEMPETFVSENILDITVNLFENDFHVDSQVGPRLNTLHKKSKVSRFQEEIKNLAFRVLRKFGEEERELSCVDWTITFSH